MAPAWASLFPILPYATQGQLHRAASLAASLGCHTETVITGALGVPVIDSRSITRCCCWEGSIPGGRQA